MNNNGFTIIRNSIEEHQRMGEISFFELGIFVTMLRQADWATGVWMGRPSRLLESCPRGTTEEEIGRALARLCRIKWLKSLQMGRHKRRYAYVIHRFEVTDGAHKGRRIDAWKSTDYKNPVFIERQSSASRAQTERQPSAKK